MPCAVADDVVAAVSYVVENTAKLCSTTPVLGEVTVHVEDVETPASSDTVNGEWLLLQPLGNFGVKANVEVPQPELLLLVTVTW